MENVKRKDCLWCSKRLPRMHKNERNNSKVCPECKRELVNIKKMIGRPDWLKILKENGIEPSDLYENYEDYKNTA